MIPTEHPTLDWRDGIVPVSTRFDDPYFSQDDGLSETRHVFLAGNDLPARLHPGFHVAELGFGTGLNLLAEPFLDAWARGETRFSLGQIEVDVVIGDARETLAAWAGCADVWFLDGFSPAKNPELWSADIMAEVARHTAKGGTFATYTAAGHVRRSLADAGFAVERRPGHGKKRHMSVGTLL
jgi:tRNA U34 5-methylaminomethyl-2-thiouridine-forming methyltransferase MnmC